MEVSVEGGGAGAQKQEGLPGQQDGVGGVGGPVPSSSRASVPAPPCEGRPGTLLQGASAKSQFPVCTRG